MEDRMTTADLGTVAAFTGPQATVPAVGMRTVIDVAGMRHAIQCGRQDCPVIADLVITMPSGYTPATIHRCVLCWFPLRDVLTSHGHDLTYEDRAVDVIQQVLLGEVESLDERF
jgi:hypothetical protein